MRASWSRCGLLGFAENARSVSTVVCRSGEAGWADVGDEDDVGFCVVGGPEDGPVFVVAGDGDGPGVDGLEAVAADGGVAGVAGDAGQGFVNPVGELAPGGVGIVLQAAEAIVVFVVEPDRKSTRL